MEKLNQIREELLASQNKLAKELQLGEYDCKSFVMNGIGYFVTDKTLLARTGDYELEVNEFIGGRQRITITGDIPEAVKALAEPMKQWRKIANFSKDLDTKEYYLNLYKRIEKSFVRNGNEYEVDGFKFYFPNLYSMQITKGSFYVIVERIEKRYCIDENVQYGGTDMIDYLKTNEEKILTNLLEQMSDDAVFGAQCIKEDFLDEAKEMEREFETDNL